MTSKLARNWCKRCGTAGKKSRDEAETLFCPKCGIWLNEEEEIPTDPMASLDPHWDSWAEALQKSDEPPSTKPAEKVLTWDEMWKKALDGAIPTLEYELPPVFQHAKKP